MGDMAAYLDELDAKATDYAVRVQIACAQAIIEAVIEQPRFTHWSGTATKPDSAECPACKGAGYYGLNDDTVICKCRAASDAIAAWEAHKKAYEIVRAEMDDLHRTLTQCGVPEQIPPFKTALAPIKARVLYLMNATRAYTHGGTTE